MLESQGDFPVRRNIKSELEAEVAPLDEKIEKLDAFIYDPGTAFDSLSYPKRTALNQQLHAMRAYSLALKQRIRLEN